MQLIFEGKPSEEVRKQLKANGCRWSPSEGAWQRHISPHALYSAESIAEKLKDAAEKPQQKWGKWLMPLAPFQTGNQS